MQIPLPRILARASDRFVDWGNLVVWQRGRLELRRLDVLNAATFLACVGWWSVSGGWLLAFQGGALYLAITAVCMFVL